MLIVLQAITKCRDDLHAITRYVTWNLNERGSGALGRGLPDQTDIVAVYRVALESSEKAEKGGKKKGHGDSNENKSDSKNDGKKEQTLLPIQSPRRRDLDRDYKNLLKLLEEAVMSRDTHRTDLVVGGLVQHIVSQWRMQFCTTVISKFNCYFMLPFVDHFHAFVRSEIQKMTEGNDEGIAEIFDLSSARRESKRQRDQLYAECMANKKLQDKFRVCSQWIRN